MARASSLVGRERALGIARDLVDGLGAGGGRAVVLEAPAGMGKTALARAVADHARGRGWLVRWGGATELEMERPFTCLAEALDLDPRHEDPWRAEAGALLRGGAGVGEGARWRLADLCLDLVERDAAATPSVLVLEDLHWADVGTAGALARLGRRLDDLRVLLLVTLRPEPQSEHVGALLRELDRHGARRLPVTPLSADEVARLVEARCGAAPSARLGTVLDRAGGNPLWLHELLDALEEGGALTRRLDGGDVDVDGDVLPPSLRLTIVRRLGHLPAKSVEVLQAASVLGESVGLPALAAFLERDPREVADLLEPAARAGLLDPDSDGVTFHHALIRDALYDDVPAPRRLVMHRRAAATLRAAGAPVDRWAVHLERGLDPHDAQGRRELLDAAAALVDHAPTMAATAARRVADALPAGDPLALPARVVLARAAARLGRPSEAEELAASLDRGGLDPEVHLELWATVTLARHMRADRNEEALAAYEALARSADVPAEVRRRHLATIAFNHRWHDVPRALALVEEAGGVADPAARALLETARGTVMLAFGDPTAALAATQRAVDICRDGGLAHAWVGLEALAMWAFLRAIDPEAVPTVRERLGAAIREAEERGLVFAVPRLHVEVARGAWFQGEYDLALAHAQTASRLLAEHGYREVEVSLPGIEASIALDRGQDELAAQLRTQVPDHATITSLEGDLDHARVLLRRGEPDAAWARIVRFLAWHEELGLAARVTTIWTLPVVEAALAVGERRAAEAWAEHLDQIVADGGAGGPIEVVADTVHAALDRTPEAARRLVEAVRLAAVHPFRLDGLRLAGEVFAEHGLRDEAVAVLREGRELAERATAWALVAQYDALLRDLGVRRGAVGTSRPDTGWEALTEAELRVVELVSEGLVYREVGERLFVSRRTVETHVANAFRKVGVGNRHELTRAWLERGVERA